MPELVKLHSENQGKLVIIGMHMGKGTREQVEAIVKDKKLNYPVVMLDNLDEAAAWGVGQALPSVALVGKNGKVRYMDLPVDEALVKMRELLAEPAPR